MWMSVFSFSAHNVSSGTSEGMLCICELWVSASKQAQLTEIIDVEDTADGATGPAVSDLAL
jgi:hypothetical protein